MLLTKVDGSVFCPMFTEESRGLTQIKTSYCKRECPHYQGSDGENLGCGSESPLLESILSAPILDDPDLGTIAA